MLRFVRMYNLLQPNAFLSVLNGYDLIVCIMF
jgi:hypothetical protein